MKDLSEFEVKKHSFTKQLCFSKRVAKLVETNKDSFKIVEYSLGP